MQSRTLKKHSSRSVLSKSASIVLSMKRTRVLAPCQNTAQSKQRCRIPRTTLDTMISLDTDGPAHEQTLRTRATTLTADHGGTLETKSCTTLSMGEKKKGHTSETDTGNTQRCRNETEAIPRRQVRRSPSTTTIVEVLQDERRSSQWNEPLTT